MEETEGRFKIVFAGGAGVFRVSRLRKHPLAGFGASIALGSLADGGEVRAARALVEEPLNLLGYGPGRARSRGSSRTPATIRR